ncbi:MAG: hypothetical protein LKF74_01530 [Megasphaera sp.]|jgi:predicted Holliday junction resolvase-like endonuclease|nr:hypothetical protein [Megasphaera sp.]MCH4187258.1 hypothetical protein [Megasphaera sp.]MCH4217224.1 hypothetical protein [Megasphaera sp.]
MRKGSAALRWKEQLISPLLIWLKAERKRSPVLFILIIVVVAQFLWILALQYQISSLSEQVHIQETRIAQTEQAYDKQNHDMYTARLIISDIQKKWNDLNFRVLENTWKLNP